MVTDLPIMTFDLDLPVIPIVNRDLVDGPEDFEALPDVRPRRALQDLAHVDDPALLDLARRFLAPLPRLHLAPLVLSAKHPEK